VFREIADIGTGESKPFTNGYTFAQFFDSFIWVPIIPSSQLSVDGEGDLLIKVQDRILRQVKPLIYQTSADGARHTIEGHYVLAHGQFAFSLGDYDHSRALIIDPTFVYSTYLGGSGIEGALTTGDMATAVAVDGAGDAYVTGITMSPDFPTYMPLQSANEELSGRPTAFVAKLNAAGSAFVTKLNSSGSALIYSTYLGGSTSDAALAVAVDASGDAYLSGYTTSSDFPIANALQPHNATGGHGANAFVTKFNPTGSGLIYSTYLGGSTYEQANGLALDAAGNAYIAGTTYSNNFPIVEALQATNHAGSHNANNAFISVLNPSGSTLEFSTYLGGSGLETSLPCPADLYPCGPVYVGDSAAAIAVDSLGNLYVTGLANSTDFPTVAAIQTRPTAIFVTKIAQGQQSAPPIVHAAAGGAGGGALGWGAISMLGFAVAMRRGRPRGRICDVGPP
jgi:Beta-propeller repeat